jgi:hypothetical protein
VACGDFTRCTRRRSRTLCVLNICHVSLCPHCA